MWNHYRQFIFKKATGKMALVMFFLYLICSVGLMGLGKKHINALSGKKVQILDLCITGYSPDDVLVSLGAYTQEARKFAAMFNLTADTLYPIVYTAMLSILLGFIFRYRYAHNSRYGYILLLPLLMMILDFLENYHIVGLLNKYPEIPVRIVEAASFFTVLKWLMFGVILSFILLGAIANFIRGKKQGRL